MSIIESHSRIEPCFFGENVPVEIADIATEIREKVAAFKIHPRTAESLASIVRVMNCYYSNLIEGHDTKLHDIERALQNDFSDDKKNRNLQIEAKAHIRVQEKIDALYSAGKLSSPTSVEFIQWLHQEFYAGASEEMLIIKDEKRLLELKLEPGKFRNQPEHNVIIGNHIPPSSEAVLNFMSYFDRRYSCPLSKTNQLIAIASAHHRLAFIHPFLDGNGRVARLMSHAMALNAGIGINGLWSISRGLARGLQGSGEYKLNMSQADMVRQGSLDGRGNLSERELKNFTVWFLKLCLDQIVFMTALFQMQNLTSQLEKYVEIKGLPQQASKILKAVVENGQINRGEAEFYTGFKSRRAREVLAQLLCDGILSSETPKSPVFLKFNIESAKVVFPKLFQD